VPLYVIGREMLLTRDVVRERLARAGLAEGDVSLCAA
jgi:hypothetical protein